MKELLVKPLLLNGSVPNQEFCKLQIEEPDSGAETLYSLNEARPCCEVIAYGRFWVIAEGDWHMEKWIKGRLRPWLAAGWARLREADQEKRLRELTEWGTCESCGNQIVRGRMICIPGLGLFCCEDCIEEFDRNRAI